MWSRNKTLPLTFIKINEIQVPLVYKPYHWQKMKETFMNATKSSSAVKHLWLIICPSIFLIQTVLNMKSSFVKLSSFKEKGYQCFSSPHWNILDEREKKFFQGHCPQGDSSDKHVYTSILHERSLKNTHSLWIAHSKSNNVYSNFKIPQDGTNFGTATYDRLLRETLKDTVLGKLKENNQWAYRTHFFKKNQLPLFSKILANHKTMISHS